MFGTDVVIHTMVGSIIMSVSVTFGIFYPLTDPFIHATLISENTSLSDLTGH